MRAISVVLEICCVANSANLDVLPGQAITSNQDFINLVKFVYVFAHFRIVALQ